MISERDSAGMRYLWAALREGRLDSGMLPVEQADPAPSSPIVIEPLTVAPLVAAADLESGVSQ